MAKSKRITFAQVRRAGACAYELARYKALLIEQGASSTSFTLAQVMALESPHYPLDWLTNGVFRTAWHSSESMAELCARLESLPVPAALARTKAPEWAKNVSRNNTRCYEADGVCEVLLHNTTIVSYNRATRELTLNTGGWNTVTTASRMNQAVVAIFGQKYSGPVSVHRKKWIMHYVVDQNWENAVPFSRTVTITVPE